MKIALATTQLVELGGRERDCLAIGRYLTQRGHEACFYTMAASAEVASVADVRRVSSGSFTNHGRARALARALREAVAARSCDV